MEIQGSLHQVGEKAHCSPKGINSPCPEGELQWPKEEWSWTCSNTKPCPRLVIVLESLGLCQEHQEWLGQSQSNQQDSVGWISLDPWPGKGGPGHRCGRKPGKGGCLEGRENTEVPSLTPLFPIHAVHIGSNRYVMPRKLFLEQWLYVMYSRFQEVWVKVAPENCRVWKYCIFWERFHYSVSTPS